jgi:hypothetical protein
MDATSPSNEAVTIDASDGASGAKGDSGILFSRFSLTEEAAGREPPRDLDMVGPHVDAAFYRARYPHIARDGIDPAVHYLRQGWREGRQPNSWFDTLFYLQRYPDVASSGMNPLVHYIRHGRDSGREPHPPEPQDTPKPQYASADLAAIAEAMDLIYYRGVYRDIDLPNLDPVEHFHRAGWREGRKPNPWFDPAWYLQAYTDIAKAGIDPLLHYIRHGRREGRSPMAPGGQRRAVVDGARVPRTRPVGYDAPDPAPFLGTAELAQQLRKACVGANGIALSVSHDRYIDIAGGIELFIADEQSCFNADRFAYVHIAPSVARLTLDMSDEQPPPLQVVIDGRFAGLTTTTAFAEVLEALPPEAPPVRVFIIHSIFGHCAADLAALAAKMRPSVACFWLHDYATICEGYNLLRNDLEFCHAPPQSSTACRVCVYGASRADYLEQVRSLFEAVPFDVLAPSRAALEVWRRTSQLPHRATRVHPHAVFQAAPADAAPAGSADQGVLREPARIAFVGYPLAHKGWPLFVDLFAAAHALGPYTFYHFCADGSRMPMTGMISVAAGADLHDRSGMITAVAEHGIELVLVLSPWPETFSYVAHEAFAAGADVVTLAVSGNVADAVRAHERGVVLRDTASLLRFFTEMDAARYVIAQRAAGLRPGRLVITGTTATYDPAAGDGDAEPLTTKDPALSIVAAGALLAADRDGDCYRFDLPDDTREVRLVSRFQPPLALYAAAERRRAGVAIARISLDGVEVPIRDPRRASGWHPPATPSLDWQWTDGDAMLLTAGARRLEIVVQPKLHYRRCPIGAHAG